MPLIDKQDRTEREDLKVKIRPEVIRSVEDYAKFIDSDPWYVVQELLRKSIAGDKDFHKWKADQSVPAMQKKAAVA